MNAVQQKDSAVLSDGKHLIESYLACEREVAHAKSRLNSAECDMANAKNALGKWLCPTSAVDGEKFCVWHCGHLIEAVREDQNTYKITIRERARP